MAAVYILSILLFIECVCGETVTISTELGDMMGTHKGNYAEFLGIPYTENAPVGQYRFTESEMRASVYSDAGYDATSYGAACVQPPAILSVATETQSEDCLFINIQTPNIDVNGTVLGDLLPVMFYIHGGGWFMGSSYEYDGRKFLTNSNVVFVSINYRLAGLGYMALESIYNETNGRTTGGMNGVHDVIVALQWVQNYIQDYGGDPQQVAIFGEAAGASTVCFLSIMPSAAGLFDQVIIQSGHCSPPYSTQRDRDVAIAASQAFLTASNFSDNLEELRAANVSLFRTTPFTLPWPSVDGYYLQQTTHEMLTSNNFSLNVDKIIIGSTSLNSIRAFPFGARPNPLARPPETDDEFSRLFMQYIGDEASVELLANTYYPLSDFPEVNRSGVVYSSQTMRYFTINSDACWTCANRLYLDSVMNHPDSMLQDDDVYLYQLIGPEEPHYMPHTSELTYLYGNTSFTYNADLLGIAESQSLADFMLDAWINFGVYGVPNSTLNEEQWIPFGVNRSGMVFGNDGTNAYDGYNVVDYATSGYRNGACDFWLNTAGFEVIVSLCGEQETFAPTMAPTEQPTAMQTTEISMDTTDSIEEDEESAATKMQYYSFLALLSFLCF